MSAIRRFADSPFCIWLPALALAALELLPVWQSDRPDPLWRAALDPTGQTAAIALALTLAVTPLEAVGLRGAILVWLKRQRKHLGLAAFAFAVFHLALVALALGKPEYILRGLAWAKIWTGWVSLLMMAPVALTSNRLAHARLGVAWKPVQRLTWASAAFAAAHWYLQSRGSAFFWIVFASLILLEIARLLARRRPAH